LRPVGIADGRLFPIEAAGVTTETDQGTTEAQYEEHFCAFIDFLGFSEASTELDEATRIKVLRLLLSIASLRSDFSSSVVEREGGAKSYHATPAISTFSDHIVISYALQPLAAQAPADQDLPALIVMSQFQRLVTAIAVEALRIGFLVRGGATIGKLYHTRGVVFGEAMIEAVALEARTAVYPRIVLSHRTTQRPGWTDKFHGLYAVRDDDGIYCLDYLKMLLLQSAPPGDSYWAGVQAWFDVVVPIIDRNLEDLERNGRLNEFAKWRWFAKKFRGALEKTPPEMLKPAGVSIPQNW